MVIPARNDAAALADAVRSVFAQEPDVVSEVVIAVAPSNDATAEVAAELANDPRVRVVDNPAGRTGNGLNAAASACDGDVLVRVDAHSILPPTYVADALETMSETGAGNVGAIQSPVGRTRVQRGIATAMRSRLGSGAVAYRGTDRRQRVDTAFLGVFARAAFDEVGGYDPEFVRNQDAELNIRLANAGYEVWLDPRLVVEYRPRASIGKLARQYWDYGWWRARTVRKHPGSLRWRQLAAPLVVLSTLLSGVLAVIASPWFGLLPLLYLCAVVAVALAASGPVAERAISAAAIVTMHFSWGSSFLLSTGLQAIGVR